MIPNPWIILGGVLLVLALCAGSAYEGHEYGVDAQKATDQKEFDKINAERAQQKADAAALMQKAQSDIIVLQNARDKFKTDLEAQREQDRKTTAALTAKYSALSLRFSAVQGGTDRPDGGGAVSSPADAASSAGAPVVQLPDEITVRLRSLAADADTLRDDYAKCYRYATEVR